MSTPSRGNRRRFVAATAVTVSAALILLGTGSPSDGASPVCGKSIALVAPLSSFTAPLGGNMLRGAQLAVEKYNHVHPGCTVTLKKFDTQGDPAKAPAKATAIVADDTIIGVVGPAFSGETMATGDTFMSAGLPTLTPSATNPTLSAQGWSTFHRAIASDTNAAPLLAKYIGATLHGTKVALVVDDEDYGRTFIRGLRTALGSKVVATKTVHEGQTNFASTVSAVLAKHPQVVVYGGFYFEAGRLAKQLTAAGFAGSFVSNDGSIDPAFAQLAGAEAAGRSYLTGGFAPPTLNSGFTKVFRNRFQRSPGNYTLEAFDAATVFLSGIATGNVTDRTTMATWLSVYDAKGLTKQYGFTSKGELADPTLWVYKPYLTRFVAKARLQ